MGRAPTTEEQRRRAKRIRVLTTEGSVFGALGHILGALGLAAAAAAHLGCDGGAGASTPFNPDLAFIPTGPFPTGTHPNSAGVADWDGDGDLDIAVPALVDERLVVLRADGGGFSTVEATPMAAGALDAAVADVDGDGSPELIVTLQELGLVQVLAPTGGPDLDFAVAGEIEVAEPAFIAAGDADGDGDADLVVSRFDADDVVVLLGDGAGGFEPLPPIAVPNRPGEVALCDADGDGVTDIAVVGSVADTVAVLRGDGAGGWEAWASTALGEWPVTVDCAELDGDPGVELVGATNLGNTLYVAEIDGGSPAGGMRARELAAHLGAFGTVVADLDGDRLPDVAVTNKFEDSITVFRNLGDGELVEATTFPTGGGPTPLFAADFDGDGVPDLATVNGFSNDVMLHLAAP